MTGEHSYAEVKVREVLSGCIMQEVLYDLRAQLSVHLHPYAYLRRRACACFCWICVGTCGILYMRLKKQSRLKQETVNKIDAHAEVEGKKNEEIRQRTTADIAAEEVKAETQGLCFVFE